MTPPDVTLVLRTLPDPQAGPGVPARDATLRLRLALKVLLRGYGFRCVAVRDRQPSDPTPDATPETSP